MILGYVTRAETKSRGGVPGLSLIPGLSFLASSGRKEVQDTQIMLMVTPHILSAGRSGSGPEVWVPPTVKTQ